MSSAGRERKESRASGGKVPGSGDWMRSFFRSRARRFRREPLTVDISWGHKIAAGIFRNDMAGKAPRAGARTPKRGPVWFGERASFHTGDRTSPVGKQTILGCVSFRHMIPPSPRRRNLWTFTSYRSATWVSEIFQSAARTCRALCRSFPRLRLIAWARGRNGSTGGRRNASRSSAIFRRTSWGA